MTKRKKTEKPEPRDITTDKSETLARAPSGPSLGKDVVGNEHFAAPNVGRQMTITPTPDATIGFQTCAICGTRRVCFTTPENVIKWADTCHVDGYRFPENK